MVAEAEELTGYGPYIDQLGAVARHKSSKRFRLGEEEARCRYALERAAEGRQVALVCSGDAGIYAMASLVYELLDRGDVSVPVGAQAVEIVVSPGVTAAAAARSVRRRPARPRLLRDIPFGSSHAPSSHIETRFRRRPLPTW